MFFPVQMMNRLPKLEDKIFCLQNEDEFNETALQVFRFQAQENLVYKSYLSHLNVPAEKINHWTEIPFLPIEFFKTHSVVSFSKNEAFSFFASSGTTGSNTSKHFFRNYELYERSFLKTFETFFGNIEDYTFLALLPNYLEQQHSSLIYMINKLIEQTPKAHSGFYKKADRNFIQLLETLNSQNEKIILLGVTYSLLDLVEQHQFQLKNTLIFETGGMKGRRKEMVREALHSILCQGFGVDGIASEYGMTELFSQAYSFKNGIYQLPPWMKIRIREINDPFAFCKDGKRGGICVVDLANLYSCSFIATQDLGTLYPDNTFSVEGRFDNSDIRGCNLLMND